MSIATQITALANDRTAIQNAIIAKGGTVSSADGFDDFAAAIGTIPSGGSSSVLHIFASGVIDSSVGDVVLTSSAGSLVKNGLTMDFKAAGAAGASIASSNKVDVSSYSKLICVVNKSGSNPLRVGISSSNTGTSYDASASVTSGNQIVTVDISGKSGSFYVKLDTTVYNSAHTIYSIYLV